MDFQILKVLHIGSMFMATALAVGPLVLMYLVARTREANAIQRSAASVASCTASVSCSARRPR